MFFTKILNKRVANRFFNTPKRQINILISKHPYTLLIFNNLHYTHEMFIKRKNLRIITLKYVKYSAKISHPLALRYMAGVIPMMLRNVLKNTGADENPTSAAISLSDISHWGSLSSFTEARTRYSAKT